MIFIMLIPKEQMNTIEMSPDMNKKFKMLIEVFNNFYLDIFNGEDFIDNVLIP
jgi:hypothetical protein